MANLFEVACAGAAVGGLGQLIGQPQMISPDMPTALVVGGATGAAAWLVENALALRSEWKPVIFGDSLHDRIATLIVERPTRPRRPIVTPIGDIETKCPESETKQLAEKLDRENQ